MTATAVASCRASCIGAAVRRGAACLSLKTASCRTIEHGAPTDWNRLDCWFLPTATPSLLPAFPAALTLTIQRSNFHEIAHSLTSTALTSTLNIFSITARSLTFGGRSPALIRLITGSFYPAVQRPACCRRSVMAPTLSTFRRSRPTWSWSRSGPRCRRHGRLTGRCKSLSVCNG